MTKKNVPTWFNDHVPVELLDSSMFRFNVKFPNGQTIELDLTQDIDIDYEILEEHLEKAPAQYMYWTAVYSELKSNVAGLEITIKRRRSAIAAKTIETYKKEGTRLTDKQLQAIVEDDEKLTKLEAKLAIAQKHVGKVYHMVEAVRMKSENCRSLAGFKRQDKEQAGNMD